MIQIMCAFAGAFFLVLMLALWWLGSFFPTEGGPGVNAAPPASRSFDLSHLFGYAMILYVAGYALVLLHEKSSSKRKRLLRSGKRQTELEQPAPDPKRRMRQWITGGIIVVACVAMFSLWRSDHEVPPPLSVSYRGSYLGKGRVLIITNTSGVPMYEIRVKVDNPNGAGDLVTNELTAASSKEVGWRQLSSGQLNTGQMTYVYAKGYTAPVIAKVD